MYESDHTKFMREYLKDHPEVVNKQRDNRATYWEKEPQPLEPTYGRKPDAPVAGKRD